MSNAQGKGNKTKIRLHLFKIVIYPFFEESVDFNSPALILVKTTT